MILAYQIHSDSILLLEIKSVAIELSINYPENTIQQIPPLRGVRGVCL